MKKIKAFAGECVPSDTEVIVDDYPNQDDESELAVNINMGDEFINLYRNIKDDGTVEFVVITIDKNSKVLTRYEAKKTNDISMSNSGMELLSNAFRSVSESCNEMSI